MEYINNLNGIAVFAVGGEISSSFWFCLFEPTQLSCLVSGPQSERHPLPLLSPLSWQIPKPINPSVAHCRKDTFPISFHPYENLEGQNIVPFYR